MIIQDDPEALNYVNAILHPLARKSGSFLTKFCEACLHADFNNYELLRPALHIFMQRYPADPERLKMEEQDNQGENR